MNDNNDPAEPLYDLGVIGGALTLKVEQPEPACPCSGLGWLGREWLYKREPQCTCGAGDPTDVNLLHNVACDSVPCPFCPAELELHESH